MARHILSAVLLGVVIFAIVINESQAGSSLRIKKLIKAGLIARAFSPKKILFPLPLPLPIPIFKENVHHQPYPVHHHSHAEIGYGLEHGGGGYGGGGYGGGGYGGGGYGGGYGGGGYGGGEEWW